MAACKNTQKISTEKDGLCLHRLQRVQMRSTKRFHTWLDTSLECSTAIAPAGTPFLVNSDGINLLKARSFSRGPSSSVAERRNCVMQFSETPQSSNHLWKMVKS